MGFDKLRNVLTGIAVMGVLLASSGCSAINYEGDHDLNPAHPQFSVVLTERATGEELGNAGLGLNPARLFMIGLEELVGLIPGVGDDDADSDTAAAPEYGA